MTKPLSIAEARAAGILPPGNSPKSVSSTAPQAPCPLSAVLPRSEPEPSPEVLKTNKPALACQVSTYDFKNGCNRVVFPLVPKEQTQAFIQHCQQFKP